MTAKYGLLYNKDLVTAVMVWEQKRQEFKKRESMGKMFLFFLLEKYKI
jgi:hypothetical protein